MSTTQSLENELLNKHSLGEIPRTNKRTFKRGKTFVFEAEDTTLLLQEGDVLWNEYKDEFSIILNIQEATGIVQFNLSKLYYGFVPADYIWEDYVEDDVEIIEDPWNLQK